METSVVIERRFNGPPASANGGYACGVLAQPLDGTASVSLRVPPPLDTPMTLSDDGHKAVLYSDGEVIGEAERTSLTVDAPHPPSIEEAVAASTGYIGFDYHPFETCFVCGPARAEGDGLRIFPGRLPGSAVAAAHWVPDPSLAGDGDVVARNHVWAALDCPSYFGLADPPPALLANLTARIDRLPHVGEPLVAMGWETQKEGRKHHSASALATGDGEVIAVASALWIEPRSGLPT